eukprot:718860-Hanusia_phi.AAC.5
MRLGGDQARGIDRLQQRYQKKLRAELRFVGTRRRRKEGAKAENSVYPTMHYATNRIMLWKGTNVDINFRCDEERNAG